MYLWMRLDDRNILQKRDMNDILKKSQENMKNVRSPKGEILWQQ